ncbi:MAG: PE-PPE domain-containing protein [Mycobacteriaceae bacterium]
MRGMRLRSFAAQGTAALTLAGAMTLGGPAAPAAADVDFGAVTTGPLFGIAQALGFTTIPIPDVDVIGTITIRTAWDPAIPVVLADAVNAFAFGGYNPLGASFKRQPGGTLGAAILGGTGFSAYNAGLAYQALLASAAGNTPAGYTPLEPSGKVSSLTGAPCTTGPGCVQGTNITNLAVLQVNNPGTPNGGLYARFAPILNLFGVQAVSAGGASASSTGVALNAATIGLALGYNALSDFPETPNPFSLINSLLATALPTHLLGGGTLQGASEDLLYAKLGTLATLNVPSTSYSTYVSADLPLLEPLRLPARVINTVLGALGVGLTVPTPLADALQPALQILVNTGYTDVQTPADGGTYNRTFKSSGEFVPFMSRAVLTPQEWSQVPGDVLRALVVGFQDSFPLLRLGQSAPTLTVDGNHLAITYPPAPAAAAAKRTATAPSAAAVAPRKARQSASSQSASRSAAARPVKPGVGRTARAAT